MNSKDKKYAWFWEKLKKHIESKGLRDTKQRNKIIQEFLDMGGHIDAESLHSSIQKKGIKVGIATVYRTLKFLEEAKLVTQSVTHGASASFEILSPKDHHDHLICLSCSKVVEFCDPKLEKDKERITKKLGFQYKSHQLTIYGICEDCVGEETNS